MKYPVKTYQHTSSLFAYIQAVLNGEKPSDAWVPKNSMIKGTNGKQHLYCRAKQGIGEIFVSDESDPHGYYADFIKDRLNRYIPDADVKVLQGTGSDLDLEDYGSDPFTIIKLKLN